MYFSDVSFFFNFVYLQTHMSNFNERGHKWKDILPSKHLIKSKNLEEKKINDVEIKIKMKEKKSQAGSKFL